MVTSDIITGGAFFIKNVAKIFLVVVNVSSRSQSNICIAECGPLFLIYGIHERAEKNYIYSLKILLDEFHVFEYEIFHLLTLVEQIPIPDNHS